MCLTHRILLILFSCAVLSQAFPQEAPFSVRLDSARTLFYASVSDSRQIEPAMIAFNTLMREDSSMQGRAMTYLGALVALKGKHSFWPHDKLHWANRGLELMDQGVARSPDDIEALFIHSSTCYFLPFFFNRGKDAQEKFRIILHLLPQHYYSYDMEINRNVVRFLAEKAHLDQDGKILLEHIKKELGLAETP